MLKYRLYEYDSSTPGYFTLEVPQRFKTPSAPVLTSQCINLFIVFSDCKNKSQRFGYMP
jgi:hypothetical protein